VATDDVRALLDAYAPDGPMGLCWQYPERPFMSTAVAPDDVPGLVAEHMAASQWLSVATVAPELIGTGKRGGVEHVRRLLALPTDFDVKLGAFPDRATALQAVDDLAAMLGVQPWAVVDTGHGLQAPWILDPDDPAWRSGGPDDPRLAVMVATVRRWGRLVSTVCQRYGASSDNVFDLARVQRIPGTVNVKDPTAPVPTSAAVRAWAPITMATLRDVLDGYGVAELPGDRERAGVVVSVAGDWPWADSTCTYARHVVTGLETDTPGTSGRHPWLIGKATRLAALHRYGCLTEYDHGRAADALASRFRALLTDGNAPKRDEHPGEFADAMTFGARKVEGWTDAQVAEEFTPKEGEPHRHTDALPEWDASVANDGAPPSGNDDGTDKPERKSTATALVELALRRYRLGSTEDGDTFGVQLSGPRIVRPLRGSRGSLRAELADAYWDATGRAAPQAALADALLVLEGKALRCAPESLAIRAAEYNDDVVLDLGGPTGHAVRVSRVGWEVVPESPVLFRRSELTSPLPEPLRGGALDPLWGLLNVPSHARPLIIAWLVAALIADIPHPVLALHGEQGTGKSTASTIVAQLIDPSGAQVRKPPRDVDAWVMMAQGSWVPAIDNVSHIPDWLSDTLCRAVTGDGDVRRTLYGDKGLTVFSFRRPVLLNGIAFGSLRSDLADRLLIVELSPITGSTRRTESELRREWERIHPTLLGGLLDVTAKVLDRLPHVRLDTLPRMADFARVLAAVDDVMGTDGLAHYTRQASALSADAVASDPVTVALGESVTAPFTGTAAELLVIIRPPDERWRAPRDWPRTSRALTAHLTRMAYDMRKCGWTVESHRDAHRKVTTWELIPPTAGDGARRDVPQTTPATPATPAYPPRGAGKAGHAGMDSGQSLLLDEDPPSSTGPCAGCGSPMSRYGSGVTSTLCEECRAAA